MKNSTKFLSKILVAVIVCLILTMCVGVVEQNKYGLIMQFGKIIRVVDEPKLVFKAPWQTVKYVPKDEQLYDLESSDVITSDKKSMIADCFCIWYVIDPIKYAQTATSIENVESRSSVAVYNAMKNLISSYTQDEVINGKDGTLSVRISEKVANSMDEYGVKIKSVDMKLLDLPEENKEAVYNRMISERNKIAAEYTAQGDKEANIIKNQVDSDVRSIKSDAEREAQEIIAEGEKEYMQIIADAYNSEDKKEFYNFLRGIEASKVAIPSESTLYLDEDSPLVKIITGKEDKTSLLEEE